MAATGSNHKERHLAQPPRGFLGVSHGRRGLHFPIWVVAVLLLAALSLAVFPAERGEAASVASPAVAQASGAPVVPILFPLVDRVNWTNTFGQARSGGRTHAGNDIMVPKMAPIIAVVDGKLDWLNTTGKPSSYNNLPYYNILLRGDDGNDYFYIHLNNDTPGTDDGKGGVQYAYAPGLTNGSRVKAGDLIGYAGDSGNAEDCGSHLHFEIHLGGYKSASSGQTRTPSSIDPYPSLKAAPTLAEWEAAGRPPVAEMIADPGSTSTPTSTTTTTAADPAATTSTTSTTSTTATTTATTVPPAKPGDKKVPGYTDVMTTDWFYDDFALARVAGVVPDQPDERFRPYSKVSRARFASYLVRAMAPDGLKNLQNSPVQVNPTFTDVAPDHWAYYEIETAARLGLVQGTGGYSYSPEELVTRAQMATMICRALGGGGDSAWAGDASYLLYADVPPDYWAQGAIFVVDQLGLMCGGDDGLFHPVENCTRAQAITVMARLMRLLEGSIGL
ncbi:MAG: S-layer homology domain-containing protein [Thermoleophilia bacterium]|nr:S-layer homology domain-containing protein [Thermoleophilia bacterium]